MNDNGALTRLLNVVVKVLVVYNDGAVPVISGVRRLPVLVLVERLLILVQPHVPQQAIVQISWKRGQLGSSVPVVQLLHPVRHQRWIFLRCAVRGFGGQVLMIARGDRALRAQWACEVLSLPVPRDDQEDGHREQEDDRCQNADYHRHVIRVVLLDDRNLGLQRIVPCRDSIPQPRGFRRGR